MKIKANYISKYIRSRRVELRLSQQKLTRSLGWNSKTTQYLSNIELGKSSFPTRYINQLSCALNVDRSIIIEAMVKDFRDSLENETIGDIK
jgi:transcriptional regulator with XRE-family HTH domain